MGLFDRALNRKVTALEQLLNATIDYNSTQHQINDKTHECHSSSITNLNKCITDIVEDVRSQGEDLTHTREQLLALQDGMTRLTDQLIELAKRDQNVNTPDLLKYGKEPWFSLVAGDYSTDQGIRLNIDWNSAYIDQLKSLGYTGINEFQIIAKWLAAVSAHQQMQLGAE